jgi:uncharacterized membrane protein
MSDETNEVRLAQRVLELEERLAWMTLARDNLANNRDEILMRSKRRGRTSGRIISQLKQLVERVINACGDAAVADAARQQLLQILRDDDGYQHDRSLPRPRVPARNEVPVLDVAPGDADRQS